MVADDKKFCFRCRSTYKVSEVRPGLFCCGGFCLRHVPALTEADSSTPDSTQGSTKKLNFRPQLKVGDFCRITKDGRDFEAQITSISSSLVTVTLIGYGTTLEVPFKDVLPSLGKSFRDAQEAEKNWKVGDLCRATFADDGLVHEANIVSLEEDADGNRYALVTSSSGGKEQSVWLDDLVQVQKIGPGGEIPVSGSVSGSDKKSSWAIGDACRAVYSEDSLEYEGDVASIHQDDDGRQYATVRFVGYGNEENVWFEDLLDSHGPNTRVEQEQESQEEDHEDGWKVGSECRSVFEDVEYEATLESIGEDQDGNRYGEVVYVGYGNKETVWLATLLPSQGEDVRQEQIKVALKEDITEKEPLKKAKEETLKKAEEEACIKAKEEEALKKAQEEAFKKAKEEEAFKKAQEEVAFKKAKEEEAFQKAKEEEAFKKAKEEDAFKKAKEEAAFIKAKEEAFKKAQEAAEKAAWMAKEEALLNKKKAQEMKKKSSPVVATCNQVFAVTDAAGYVDELARLVRELRTELESDKMVKDLIKKLQTSESQNRILTVQVTQMKEGNIELKKEVDKLTHILEQDGVGFVEQEVAVENLKAADLKYKQLVEKYMASLEKNQKDAKVLVEKVESLKKEKNELLNEILYLRASGTTVCPSCATK